MPKLVPMNVEVIAAMNTISQNPAYEQLKKEVCDALNSYENNKQIVSWERQQENEEMDITPAAVMQSGQRLNTDFLLLLGLSQCNTSQQHLENVYRAVKGSEAQVPEGFYKSNGIAIPDDGRLKRRQTELFAPLQVALNSINEFWQNLDQTKNAENRLRRLTDIDDILRMIRNDRNPRSATFFHLGMLRCVRGDELDVYFELMGQSFLGENAVHAFLRAMTKKKCLYAFCQKTLQTSKGWGNPVDVLPAEPDPQDAWDACLLTIATANHGSQEGPLVMAAFWKSLAKAVGQCNPPMLQLFFRKSSPALNADDAAGQEGGHAL